MYGEKQLLINTFLHTFYSGFLLIRKMLCPGPDDHVHVVHTENLRKAPKSTITCDHKQVMQISLALHCGSNYK